MTWHRGVAAFLRKRIGFAADVATRAECHVNGHATGAQLNTPYSYLRLAAVCNRAARHYRP